MVKKIVLGLLMLVAAAKGMAQSYEVSKDPKNGQVVFKGPITIADLEREPSFDWLQKGNYRYKPNRKKIKILKEKLTPATYTITVFLGTWCADSHDMVPRLMKVLQRIDYPVSNVTMYGVERDKSNRGETVKKYNVTNLPTVILFKDGKEVGRITETVKRSVESDLVAMIGQ